MNFDLQRRARLRSIFSRTAAAQDESTPSAAAQQNPLPDSTSGDLSEPTNTASGARPAPATSAYDDIDDEYDDDGESQPEQRSLFGEILDWMFAPLLLLWPMSVAITYLVAKSISNAPFDRALDDNATVLAQQLKEVGGRVVLQLPVPARDILRADDVDRVYFQVLDPYGELLGGDRDMPMPDDESPTPGQIQFRNEELRGAEVRVAHLWVDVRSTPKATDRADTPQRLALVQVAETLEKRGQLANEIIKGVILPQFVILPLAVTLVWFGLTRGLAPLHALQQKIRQRRPDDLSPIDPKAAPEEIAPLVMALNELLERLQVSIYQQKRFIADAAHQLKTPLAGLRMQAELALRDSSPSEVQRSLKQIATSSENAARMVTQLLALARAENPERLVHQWVDLEAIARTVVYDVFSDALSRSIDLGFESFEQDATLRGDPVLLKELIRNLVENALRYTPVGGQVTVRVERAQALGAIVLEVEDNGPGIPDAERELVFDRFYRILGTGIEGSGLGLAIVKEIAEQHGAEVALLSNPRSNDLQRPGTLFRIKFPIPQRASSVLASIQPPAS